MWLNLTILHLYLAVLVHSAAAACSGEYVYVLTFDFNWSFDTDRGFPNNDPTIEPGFSQLVCASHSAKYTMWQPGSFLSQPMIAFVGPEGRVRPLEVQLRNEETNGIVRSFATTSEGSGSLGELTTYMRVNSTHSLISCASRILPSPSWFIGISSLDMCTDDSFRTAHDLVILGWWGGLDEAEGYGETKLLKDRPLKVRRRIDFAPYGYGTLFISRQPPNFTIPSNTADQGSSPNAAKTNGPRIVPAAEAICVDAKALRHLPRKALRYPTHRHAYVLCDPFNSCATPGHIVVYQDRPMMMKSYCQLVSYCESRVIPVNSPKYSRTMRIDTLTDNLKFTVFAARFSTRTEEGVLALAVRMGL